MTGFVPGGEKLEEGGDDDQDGSLGPPPRAAARGGGLSPVLQFGPGWVPMKLWSHDEDTQSGAGFLCVHHVTRNVFYAKLEPIEGDDEDGEATKATIGALLDVAEACAARKISLGLSPEHSGCAELLCSLLYIGFQVVAARKFPLPDTALWLEFEIGPPPPGRFFASDNTCTETSECSTSADSSEDAAYYSESFDSD